MKSWSGATKKCSTKGKDEPGRRQEIKNNFTYEAVYDPDLFVINKPNNDDEISWKTRFSLGRSQL